MGAVHGAVRETWNKSIPAHACFGRLRPKVGDSPAKQPASRQVEGNPYLRVRVIQLVHAQ